MGICASQDDDPFGEENKELEEQLRRERIEELFKFKVLLLGAGEAGKSTIVKQIRLAHAQQVTEEELVSIGDNLHQNAIECMGAVLKACRKFEYKIADEHKETVDQLDEWTGNLGNNGRIPPEFATRLFGLYKSEAFADTLKRRGEYWLLDCFDYIMNNLQRFAEDDWLPNPEDQLSSRIRTTGIDESNLEWKIPDPKEGEPDTMKLVVVDVGGQRNERKKWMHCFSEVRCILFIVNLAGYCQVLFEDLSQNRMTESLTILKDISNKDIFQETFLNIFLNKRDLFEELIKKTPLTERFPEYTGGADIKAALAYVEEQFKAVVPASNRGRVTCYPVVGVDAESVASTFLKVKTNLYASYRPHIDKELKKINEEQNA